MIELNKMNELIHLTKLLWNVFGKDLNLLECMKVAEEMIESKDFKDTMLDVIDNLSYGGVKCLDL